MPKITIMDDIIDKLIDKKKELGVTNGWIAEKSGVPEATVTKLFNGTTKSPGSATLNPIAAALGISIDTGEEIKPVPEADPYIGKLIENYEKQLQQKDKWIRILAIALAVFVAFVFCVLIYDITNLDRGWVRYQSMMGGIKSAVDSVIDYFNL